MRKKGEYMEDFENVGMEANETSENTPEVAEQETESVEEQAEETHSEETNVQSSEENARYAAARRRAEAEYAERQKAQDLEFERRFKGYVNPITQQPIRNQRDYFDALDAQETLRRNQELQSKGIDPQLFEEAVNRQVENNPTLLQAQAIIQANNEARMQNDINEGIKEIQKFDASIKTVEDLLDNENFSKILQGLQNNMSLADAYKYANLDNLIAQNRSAAKQQAINNIKGTSHLGVTDGLNTSEDEGVDIPTNELGAWKRAFPDASMKELRAKYNRSL